VPTDPASSNADDPSPQQLAQAILDHPFSPESSYFLGTTFREELQYHHQGKLRYLAPRLYWPLHALEQGRALSPFEQGEFSHALEVLDAYREASTRSRNILAMHANPDMRPKNEHQNEARRGHRIHGSPTDDAQREAQEDMATSVVEIGNLNAIQKLLHALARHPDVNVKLIDPGPVRQ
jgi:hypothetical protein